MTQVPEKQRAQAKTAPLRFHRHVGTASVLPKPTWIRAKIGSSLRYHQIKNLLREQNLHTVCEEARCPNIGECFSSGTATFMILGDVCTRRCPFCDVAHGRPLPVDAEEPQRLAQAVGRMELDYVVLTSVDRDDLRDGGAGHFARCVKALRECRPGIRIETLVPDFRGRLDVALEEFSQALPDVFNHNMETVPRLYPIARPGADYAHSLNLLARVKKLYPELPTKSGLMVGLGEDDDELLETLKDLRHHGVDRLTVGQYLAPSAHHHPVMRYLSPDAFKALAVKAREMGFVHATCGPLVRSSYHARHEDELAAST